jgi:hypothetical protein
METYERPYCFQQQDGCKPRGVHHFSVPAEYSSDEYMNETIPEIFNGDEIGVKFKTWLSRDPDAPLNPTAEELAECGYYHGRSKEDELKWKSDKSHIALFWERSFYPDFQTIANDLYTKGLIEKGDYIIEINW